MATKTQIGAVISVDGGKEYLRTVKQLAEYTKKFETEMKALTSSFDKNGKSVADLKKQKEALQKVIDSENDKLAKQKEMLDKVIKASKDATLSDEKWATAMNTVQTEINETTARINELQQEMKELNEDNALTLFVDAWENTSNKTGEALAKIGGAMTKYLTVPIVTGLAASVKVASDFEQSFTGVMKTVDEVTDINGDVIYSYQDLEKELRKIPLETSSTYEEVMSIAQAAGQLGVATQEIPWFTKNITMLGDSTNVAYEEGATSIAQFMNIVGDSTSTVDKFGSSLVALGNKTATDEASILALATRMASAGHMIGLTTPEILGLSASMSALGVTAEAGGTAISTTFQLITKSVANGDDNLQKFADVSGMTAEQFADAWRTEPVVAFQELIKGMGNLEGGGEELITFMDELGWAGIRQSDLIRRLTSDYDGMSEAIDLANKNYISDSESETGMNALTTEADKFYSTFATQISQFKESVKQLADSIGQELIPVLQPFVEKLTEVITAFSEMDQGTKDSILKLLGFVAVIGPVIGGVGNLIIWIAKLKGAFGALSGAAGAEGAGGAIKSIGEAIGGGKGGKSLIGTIGDFIGKGENLAGTISDKVVPALSSDPGVGLGFTITALTGCYVGAYNAANAMDKKMYESAEACEYVAKRYHWSEEQVNQFGYTWDETGHLVAMASQNVLDTSLEDGALLVDNIASMRDELAQLPVEMASGISESESQVQSAAFQIPMTGVEAMRPPVDEAYGYGEELATNYADGINAGASAVEAAASNLASIISSYIHFSEPDKGALSNFHTWMPDMMNQMAKGIEDNTYLVENAINRVADSLDYRYAMASNRGNVINVTNRMTVNGALDEKTAQSFVDFISERVNENLGRLV